MPKMVYINGNPVRAGSWSTKPVVTQWQIVEKHLKDTPLNLMRLDHLMFTEGSESSATYRQAYEEQTVWRLEDIRDQINALLAKFPKDRRAKALENVTGRTPAEAAAFVAKAQAIRASI